MIWMFLNLKSRIGKFNSKPPESDLDGGDGLGRTAWISAQSLCHHLMLHLDLQVGFVSSLASNKFNSIKWHPAKESTRIWTFGAWDLKPAKWIGSLDCINKKWTSQNLNSMELLPLTFPWFIGIRKVSRHQMKVESLSDDKLFKNDGDLERSGQDIGRCTMSLWQVSVQLHSACGIWVHQAQSWLPQLFHMGDWMWLSMTFSASATHLFSRAWHVSCETSKGRAFHISALENGTGSWWDLPTVKWFGHWLLSKLPVTECWQHSFKDQGLESVPGHEGWHLRINCFSM